MPKVLSEKERQQKEQRIIEKAMELYDTSSFSEITMSNLAKSCGMAKGSLFNYFPTKETLFARIMYHEYEEWGSHELMEIRKHDAFNRAAYTEFILEQTRYVLRERMRMVRLVSMKRSIINKNIAPEILAEEIEGLDNTIHILARATEKRMDFMSEERIYNLYMARHIIIIGAYDLATSPHNIEKLTEIHKGHLAVIPTEETVLKMTEEYLKLYCNDRGAVSGERIEGEVIL